MKLYIHYMKLVLQGQLRYRSVFFITAAGQFLIPFTVFASILILFGRFKQLAGWSLPEAMLCFSLAHVSFSLAECFARGFDAFSGVLSNGEFDRILVRPRNPIVQVLGARFEFSRIGRLVLAAASLAWSIANLNIEWNLLKAFALPLMAACAIAIFVGLFMVGAALCFWTTDGLEVMNIFTYAIPFGCVNYLPLLYVLDKPGATPWSILAPLFGFLFVLPCALVWEAGVRRYASTGS